MAASQARPTGAVPVSGSSYSYAYATMGELVAMMVAACLLLEYGVSGAAVAVGWSQYLNELLDNLFGFQIPEALSNSPEEGGLINGADQGKSAVRHGGVLRLHPGHLQAGGVGRDRR